MESDDDIEELKKKRASTINDIREIEKELGEATLTLDTLEACTDSDSLPVCPHCDEMIPNDVEKIIGIAEKRVKRLEQRLENLQRKKEKLEEYLNQAL